MDGFDVAELCRFSNNFKLELKNPPDFVYHYTSKEAAKNIIKGNTLRFTDRYFLNDYSEGKYIYELCKEHLKEFCQIPTCAHLLKRSQMKELHMAKRIRFLYISVL